MLARLADRVLRAASWPRVGLLLLAYAACIVPMSFAEARIKQRSGNLGVPDLMHGFSGAELYARLEAFGHAGRSIYFWAELIDMIYPLVYGTFFAFLLALAVKRVLGEGSRAKLVCLLPFAATICDYLENAAILAVVLSWPSRLLGIATAGGVFNVAKWGIFAAVLPLTVLGLGAMAVLALTRKKA